MYRTDDVLKAVPKNDSYADNVQRHWNELPTTRNGLLTG